jgi:hypothetical protein
MCNFSQYDHVFFGELAADRDRRVFELQQEVALTIEGWDYSFEELLRTMYGRAVFRQDELELYRDGDPVGATVEFPFELHIRDVEIELRTRIPESSLETLQKRGLIQNGFLGCWYLSLALAPPEQFREVEDYVDEERLRIADNERA